MGLGTNHMTTTTGANFIPEIWSKEFQIATEAKLVAAKCSKEFMGEIRQKGDILHVPKVSNLTPTALTQGTAVTFSSPTEDVVDLTVNQNFHTAFLIQRRLSAQAIKDISEAYKKKAIYSLVKKLDTDLLALYTNLTNSVGTAGVPPGDNEILDAIRYLDDADVPDEDRHFIMAPSLKATLLKLDKFTSMDYRSSAPVQTGKFGDIYGVNCYVSTNVPTSGGNPINQMLHREAYCFAKQRDVEYMSEPVAEYIGDMHVFDILYGVVTYRADHGVQVLS